MMRRSLFLALALFLVAISSASADDPIALSEYRRIVERVSLLVSQSQGAPVEARSSLLDQAAAALGGVRAVQLDSGDLIIVNNVDLIAEITRVSKDSSHLYSSSSLPARLAALRAALTQPPASATDADLTKLRDIYAQPPFKQSETESYFRQFTRRFNQWLDSLLRGTESSGSANLITIGGLIITLLVVIIFVINLRRNLAADAKLESEDLIQDAATSHSALANAQKFVGAGDFRSAVRMLYLASLLLLDERGKLRYDRSLTNREYLLAVSDGPAATNVLEPLVETFDRTWYGFEEITPAEFDKYVRQVERIKNL